MKTQKGNEYKINEKGEKTEIVFYLNHPHLERFFKEDVKNLNVWQNEGIVDFVKDKLNGIFYGEGKAAIEKSKAKLGNEISAFKVEKRKGDLVTTFAGLM